MTPPDDRRPFDESSLLSRRDFIAASSVALLGAAAGVVAAPAPSVAAPGTHVGPVKLIQLAHPRAGISRQAFDDHWRHPHGTLVHDMRGNRKYIQHHRLDSAVFKDSDSTYLAIAEVWHDSLPAADLSKDPHFIKYVQPDEPNFVDQSKHIITMAAEDVVQASRGSIAPDAPFGDLYWSDKDSNVYVTLTQFVGDRSVDWTVDESLALSRRMRTFRQVINRSVVPGSRMAIIRQFIWPTQTHFEEAVAADRDAFESLRKTPSSFLYLARSERVF
ncbi:EthD domain-containing protein [Luteibacter aegosomatis]|uniref:EthD domain-containing protein n=1 Tax=Luteibacter aegosomatis TaxID=2911537 RepID=UPI001FF736DA|nr:EthD domain-containing protein [Luteibacter aegosomatis]UPG83836.1 EthD domain-containing protein [Luteibacter aegosomatis]